LRILTFTSLYPSESRPRTGLFVENRLQELLQRGGLEARVACPVPWFPFSSGRFGIYGAYARTPVRAQRRDVQVDYPRWLSIPKLGMGAAPVLMAWSVRRRIAKIRTEFDFDLIDAHYFYPDGIAALILGNWFRRPVVITARGSDINLLPDYPLPRRWIRWAGRQCAAMVAVSAALRDEMGKIGLPVDKISVLPNGVDLELFRPLPDRQAIRDRTGVSATTILSVGTLLRSKGHDQVIRALAMLPDIELIIAGEGPQHAGLIKLAAELGLRGRVRLIGSVSQDDLVCYYNAADAVVLASAREGMPNVLLESLACGTPVVATRVGGIPEIVTDPVLGELLVDPAPAELAAAIAGVIDRAADPDSRQRVRRLAERFDWNDTTALLSALLRGHVAES